MIAPSDLRDRGVRLWDSVADDVDEPQLVVLHEACRLADRLDVLHAEVEAEGPSSAAARHARDSAQAMARLITALRLPDESGVRPQRRGMRGAQKPSAGSKARLQAV